MPDQSSPSPSSSSPSPSLIPLPGKVFLRRLDPAPAATLYLIPDAAKTAGAEAEVLAIPRDPYYEYGILIPCPLTVGQKVLIGKYAGEHDWNGRKVTIVRWDEILAVIVDSEHADAHRNDNAVAAVLVEAEQLP